MHCQKPSCVSVCPVSAMTKDPVTGIVDYNKNTCIGCRYCQVACAFNIPKFQWDKRGAADRQVRPLPEHQPAGKGRFRPAPRPARPARSCSASERTSWQEATEPPAGATRTSTSSTSTANTRWAAPITSTWRPCRSTSWGCPISSRKRPAEFSEKIQHTIYKGFIAPVALYGTLCFIAVRNMKKQDNGHEAADARKQKEDSNGHHDEFQKQEGKILTTSFFVLLTLTLIGFVLIAVRFVKGIGAVSNMSDGYPWGIWITYDVATGTAIACGGYAMAILIYIRNHMHYHPLIRSAILTSMFGYGLAGFSVMVDLGRPWNAYNFFVPSKWQVNSAMFEVALCVMAYSTVLIIEFLPAILLRLETSRWQRLQMLLLDWLHPLLVPDERPAARQDSSGCASAAAWLRPRLDKVLIFIIVLGITLPTMHQSSLGSLLLIASTKLHPLWHTGFLPLLFLINCIYIGYSIAILESVISSYAFKRPFEIEGALRPGRALSPG